MNQFPAQKGPLANEAIYRLHAMLSSSPTLNCPQLQTLSLFVQACLQ